MAKTLTLSFGGDDISLQYLPEQLSVSDVCLSETVPTLSGSATFIAPENTVRTEYQIVARIYESKRIDQNMVEVESLASAAAGVGASALIQNKPKLFKNISNVIVLARGIYDVGQRIAVPFRSSLARTFAPTDATTILSSLRKYAKQGKSCTIDWDLDNMSDVKSTGVDTRYIIKRIEAQAITMQDDTATTLAYELELSLVHEGRRIEVKIGS